MEENQNEKFENKKPNSKSAIIPIVVVIVILALIIGSIVFVYNMFSANKEGKPVVDEVTEQTDSGNVENEVRVTNVYTFKEGEHQIYANMQNDESEEENEETPTEESETRIDPGVFKIELTKGVFANVAINGNSGVKLLELNLKDTGDANSLKVYREFYLGDNAEILISGKDIPEELKDKNNEIEITLSRLDKVVDKVSTKTATVVELKEKPEGEYYVVGKDLEAGVYDIALEHDYAGIFEVKDKDMKTKMILYPWNKEGFTELRLSKDVELKDGDNIWVAPHNFPPNLPNPQTEVIFKLTK